MKEKLKPCPFCGGQSVFADLAKCHGYISCVGECKITTGDYWDNIAEHEVKKSWKEKAMEAWNRRV